MKKLFIGAMLCALQLTTAAQIKCDTYAMPLDIPIVLSSNFAEIRDNHFHSGWDMKTGGVTGKKVYSIEGGYVSRIFVSPSGFGKALYVQHPNGATSVYAHLERFEGKIAEYVQAEQYRRRSFAVDLYPGAAAFPVKRQELIGYSGNSGSSGGAHLHFEIRDQNQWASCISKTGFMKIDDTLPPQILTLYVVAIDTIKNVPVHRVAATYKPTGGSDGVYKVAETVSLPYPCYLAYEVTDRQNNTQNRMGIYAMEQKIDGATNFSFALNKFAFDQTRFVNTFLLYGESKKVANDVIRCYLSPNNPLPFYSGVTGRGVIRLADTGTHAVATDVYDETGNKSTLTFTAKAGAKARVEGDSDAAAVYWAAAYTGTIGDKLSVTIPKWALYESALFRMSEGAVPAGGYSPAYRIGDPATPLQLALTISIKADEVPENLRGKALLGYIDPAGNKSTAGGEYKNGRVVGTSRLFGTYYIAVDNTPPVIAAVSASGSNIASRGNLAFTISDNFSGISAWEATIDGKWALFDYDLKSRTITHTFDYTRFEKGKTHQVKVTATDAKGNTAVFNGNYIW